MSILPGSVCHAPGHVYGQGPTNARRCGYCRRMFCPADLDEHFASVTAPYPLPGRDSLRQLKHRLAIETAMLQTAAATFEMVAA